MNTQKPAANQPKKKAPRWRDLTDEQQWEQIYKGREQKRKAAPKSVKQAAALALPGYCMHMAIADCHATFQAEIRHDVHTAVVTSIAKVSALLPSEPKRDKMATMLQTYFDGIRRQGFYIDNREFLYAVAHATVRMADEWHYPADSPATMAAIMLKEDAELDEAGDWSLSKAHAIQMAGMAFDAFLKTELYADPETVIKAG